MRKLTNILPGLISVIITVMLFTCSSCDNGTEPAPKQNGSIVGTWQMVSIKMYDTPIGDLTIPAAQFLEMSGTGATTSILQFIEDSSASVITTYEDSSQDTIAGTWTSDGNSLTVEGAGIDDTVLFNVEGDTMTLTRTMAINFTPDSPKEDIVIDMIYNRVK
jgi:hypothetical protein